MRKYEHYFGFIVLAIILVLGRCYLKSDMHFFRLLIGLGLGYALSRGYTGFAGSVNRAYQTGSTKLMQTMMWMFLITACLSTAFMIFQEPNRLDLWVNPINLGLLLGGISFGFGMTFSACCASGVLTDLVTALPRALITLIFFAGGVFLGFPWQKQAWVAESWFSTEIGRKTAGGVFFPDWFKFDGVDGYLGALLLTALLCGGVIALAKAYEAYRKKQGTYLGHFMEQQQALLDTPALSGQSTKSGRPALSLYERLFVKAWTLKQAALAMAILFTLLMGVTGAGWGASTPYGFWFGKALNLLGVSGETLANYSLMPETAFTNPFFSNPVTVQNIGILLGTLVYLLTAKQFLQTFMSELKITPKQGLLYAIGGFTMGIGTRMANGCNVGALYTPIANLSLSGWIFFAFMVVGGILGNQLAKHLRA